MTGDVLITSGNLKADGQIDGDIVMSSGDIAAWPRSRGSWAASEPLRVMCTRQTGPRFGGGLQLTNLLSPLAAGSSPVWWDCFASLPCVLLAGLILLVAVLARRKPAPTAVPEKPAPTGTSTQKLTAT